MKARDLAALAALGVAGKYAYDKFSEKKAPAKKGADEGYSNEGRNAKFANEDYSNEGRGKAAPDYSNEGRGKIAPDYSNEGRGKVAPVAPVAVASPVRTPVVQTRSLAAAQAQPIYDNDAPVVSQKPDASRVTPYNSDIMYNTTVKSDPNVPHDDEMNRLARTRATRQGAVVAQSPNAQAQARILRQGAVMPQSPVNAQARARLLRQGAPVAQYAKGGAVKTSKPSGASRGDGIAQRGRTKGRYI